MRRPATMMGGLSEKYLKFTLGKPKCTCPSSRGTAIINRIRLSLLSSSHIRCTHLSRLSRNQILLNATHFLSPPFSVQNAGLNTNDLRFLRDTIAIVGRLKIHLWILGWFHILVARSVRKFSNLLVDTGVCCFAIQVCDMKAVVSQLLQIQDYMPFATDDT